jgi:phosphoadenosine phosphosulfate reductase
METLIKEAIDFIRQHEPTEGYFVGFSGGKDSIVTLDLVRRAGVKHEAFYSMTLIDPPEVVKFIRDEYPEVKRLKPDMTFWQGCLKKKMPLQRQRWCCTVLKHGTKSLAAVGLKSRILGLRAEESWKRARRGRTEQKKDHVEYKPIFDWSSADIWEYIRHEGLKYPTLYDEGFKRLGCVVCCMDTSKKMNAMKRERWPNMYRILDLYLEKLWEQDKELLTRKYNFTKAHFMEWPMWKTKNQRIADAQEKVIEKRIGG